MNHHFQHSQPTGRHTPWKICALLALSLLTLNACGDSDSDGGASGDDGSTPTRPAPESYGDACMDEEDLCIEGTECLAYGKDAEDHFCTLQCATDADCPDDINSSCLSLDTDEGLTKVCVPNDLCIDPDNDGYGSGPGCLGLDCDQKNPNINPGAPELCDGIDNNCSGLIDDNPIDVNTPCDTGVPGVCADGWTVCRDASIVCQGNIVQNERQEICDGLDNDCDGLVDEGPEDDGNSNFVIGIGRHCGTPGEACYGGQQVCDSDLKSIVCSDPAEPDKDILDLCDGIDNNCDGRVDEDANDPDNLLGTVCSAGVGTCRATATWSCDPDDPAAEPICPAEARDENKLPEVCDYNDNDCDGIIDNGFVNDDGVYDQVEHCGQCDNDCNDRWGGDAAAFGLAVSCEVTGASATCSSECLPGFYDLDDVPTNGCEFKPDLDAVYVSSAQRGGQDTNTCGDFDTPCLTITYAIGRAGSDSKSNVRVSEGIFKEAVQITDGISVIGGHSSRNWELDPASNVTTIQGGRALDIHVATIVAQNITKTTEISGLTVDAADARAGGNSYGIYVQSANNKLTIKDNAILAGRGGVATPGARGQSGGPGGAGMRGMDRENNRTSCSPRTSPPVMAGGAAGTNTCGSTHPAGGQGADITKCPVEMADTAINDEGSRAPSGENNSGTNGRGGLNLVFAHIKHPKTTCSTGGTNTAGNDGRNGTDGTGGSAASSSQSGGTVSGNHWTGIPGSNGQSGEVGGGGGGGGSSSGVLDDKLSPAQFHIGPTGGGGGAGGCEGNGGKGGNAGGASFGIFVAFSSETSNIPNISNNNIARNTGGQGGAGGAGGAGGVGGTGGEGGLAKGSGGQIFCANYNAQPGGAGGRGGHGGGGAGGTGGASFDIATGGNSNSAVNAYESTNTYTQSESTPTGGQGGEGGRAILNAGSDGIQGSSGNFRRF